MSLGMRLIVGLPTHHKMTLHWWLAVAVIDARTAYVAGSKVEHLLDGTLAQCVVARANK